MTSEDLKKHKIFMIDIGDNKNVKLNISRTYSILSSFSNSIEVIKNPSISGKTPFIAKYEKTQLFDKINYDELGVYVDSDVYYKGDCKNFAEIISFFYDKEFSISPSENQHMDYCSERERLETKNLYKYGLIPNSGLFFFRKTDKNKKLFDKWAEEYLKYKEYDQPALCRAICETNPNIYWTNSLFHSRLQHSIFFHKQNYATCQAK